MSSQVHLTKEGDVDSRITFTAHRSRKKFIFLAVCLAVAIIIIVGLSVALALKNQQSDEKPTQEHTEIDEDACLSTGCITAAADILGRMDLRVNPCDDIYLYSCGRWIKEQTIPEETGYTDTFYEMNEQLNKDLRGLVEENVTATEKGTYAQMAKVLYKSCMNQNLIDSRKGTEILSFIQELGGWPLLDKPGKKWNESTFDLEQILATSRQYHTNSVWPVPTGVLITTNIVTDYKRAGFYAIYIDEPRLALYGRNVYLQSRNSSTLIAYEKYILGVALALGASEETAQQEVSDFLDFEFQLANMTAPLTDRYDMEKNYRKQSILELSQKYPKFDWLRYLQGIMAFEGSKIVINSSEKVVLWMEKYFDELFEMLNSVSNRTLSNYIIWRIIQPLLSTLDEKFLKLELEFMKVFKGQKQLKPRWKTCTIAVNNLISMATGRMYVDTYFGNEEKLAVLKMIGHVSNTFKETVKNAEWMDKETKNEAKRKANGIKNFIGYPEYIKNDTYLAIYYANLNISENNYFENAKLCRRHKSLQQLNTLRDPVAERWPSDPAYVNAYYHNGLNAIVFPAGILKKPFFSLTYPRSMNFGGLGLVIGHEITHGFDRRGRPFDWQGQLHNWWTNTSSQNFKNRSECFINHYSKYSIPQIGMKVDGNRTLSENIADAGGVKQSFMAYKQWLADPGNKEIKLPGLNFTNEQLYFIGSAQIWCSKFSDEFYKYLILVDDHSPGRFRALGEMRNFDEFAKAFNCPANSYMNLQNRCSLW